MESQIRAGQKILKAADYQQLVEYEQLLENLAQHHRHRAEVAAVALAKSIKRGLEQGREQANRELTQSMALFAGRVNDTLTALEGELVELVIGCVRKVVGEIDVNERVQQAVRAGLELVRGSHKLVIRVHPERQAEVAAYLDSIPHRFSSLEVVGDDQLAVDGCILESDLGIVNASIDNQLEVIAQTLRDAFPCPAI